jgi:hypothetical protein
MKVGDRIRVLRIHEPATITDADKEMRTTELFRFCVGREFQIHDFDQYGHVELRADEDPEVREKFGNFHTVWIEPEFVEVVLERELPKTDGR